MSRIKELTYEVKKSRNFQTFTAGEVLHLDEGDDVDFERKAGLARCRKAVLDQMRLDQPGLQK